MPHTKNARRPFAGGTGAAAARAISAAGRVAFTTLVLLSAAAAQGQTGDERRLSPLSALDRQYMDAQRARINELTLLEYGGRCCRREAELAYTELFGGFHSRFYQAYQEAWPLEPGYSERRDLYNLYHLLNHLNLFGESYGAQVDRVLHTFAT